MSPARLIRCLFLVVATAAVPYRSNAQVTQINDTTSVPIEGAGHDYIHLLSETVSPANGSVTIHIQLPMPKGRGLTVPFAFAYNSNGINHLVGGSSGSPGSASWMSNLDAFASGGWSYVFPELKADNWTQNVYVLTGYNDGQPIYTDYQCEDTSNYLFTDAAGGLHSLGLGTQYVTSPPPGGCPNDPPASELPPSSAHEIIRRLLS